MANNFIKRAILTSATPSIKLPKECIRKDAKKPDGLTVIQWKSGRTLIWDITCADTLQKHI